MTVSTQLSEHLKRSKTRPFLFIGSGLSRRYLGLDTWEGLLRHFSEPLGSFDYYLSASDSKLPQAAELLAKDYAEYWWKSEEKEEFRSEFKNLAISSSSPLKIDISNYLESLSDFDLSQSSYQDELNALSGLNIDGIITTNWDLLLEALFPEYKVFIGQKSIVTDVPQNIGEIYKIHGCCSDPNSLVLTTKDYNEFAAKQAYLAAKLITIFVEHPIVFFGYSATDENILSLLKSIISGLGKAEQEKLRDNLIFVQRSNSSRPEGINIKTLIFEESFIDVMQVTANSFTGIYEAIGEQKRKLPASVLRFIKEQLFLITKDSTPEDHLCVLDFDELDQHDEIEFVVGLGVAKNKLAERGYIPIGTKDLFHYLLYNDNSLNPRLVLSQYYKQFQNSQRRYLPVFCFLSKLNIITLDELKASEYNVNSFVGYVYKDFQNKNYRNFYERKCTTLNTQQIIARFTPEKAALLIPFQNPDEIITNDVRDFLIKNEERLEKGQYATYFRKLGCLYDKLVYGW